MGKDVIIKVPTGQLKAKSSSDKLEEELKRHLNGVILSIVKWSKIIEKQQQPSKHETQHPQGQAAVEVSSTSLDKPKR